jgi:hypothetical protein
MRGVAVSVSNIWTPRWGLRCIGQTDYGGSFMGDTRETRRRHTGASPGITLILPGVPPASAGLRNTSQAYGQRAIGSFPVFGPLWEAGKRRLALSGGQDPRPAVYERLPRAWRSPAARHSAAGIP